MVNQSRRVLSSVTCKYSRSSAITRVTLPRCRKAHSHYVNPATTTSTASYFYRRNTHTHRDDNDDGDMSGCSSVKIACGAKSSRRPARKQEEFETVPAPTRSQPSSTRSTPKYIAHERPEQVSKHPEITVRDGRIGKFNRIIIIIILLSAMNLM